MPSERSRARICRSSSTWLSIQLSGSGPPSPSMLPIHPHGRYAGPTRKSPIICLLKPRSESTRRQTASCPVTARGVLIPLSAIQSIIRCHSRPVPPRHGVGKGAVVEEVPDAVGSGDSHPRAARLRGVSGGEPAGAGSPLRFRATCSRYQLRADAMATPLEPRRTTCPARLSTSNTSRPLSAGIGSTRKWLACSGTTRATRAADAARSTTGVARAPAPPAPPGPRAGTRA